ncbi:glycosyl transferase family 2 [Dyadobacter luteus]|uniref:Glycosyl transferase family 2 n=1 Tax=Dyadobacter luteus TaxID=2259619 RepID=A0A3D8Y622_9BACT|nr:glycosyltransferase [Dyadobacter luteus]REA55978.1 glycosyl transferase family 2 [Dyadobacter luteus]
MPYAISLLTIVLWLLLASYCLFTFILKYFWDKLPTYPNADNYTDFISVIIPVRNEEANIENLLNDISAQNFPVRQFEVLVVDDSSTDKTAEIIRHCALTLPVSIQLIQLSDERTASPKKRAIETAIPLSMGNLIVTTDGDCRVGTGWLAGLASCHQATGAKLMSGPVTFTTSESITDQLQIVEFSSLIGSGASSIASGNPSMCNGANLCYEKDVFNQVNGYEGVRHIASGDDEFLMHKVAQHYPGGVHFVKNPEATVQTQAHQNWTLFFRQRKRWASKWKHYQSKTPLLLALYVFSCNAALLISMAMLLCSQLSLSSFVVLAALKLVPEWIFLGSVLTFLKKKNAIPFIPLTQLFYPFYVCFFGLVAQSRQYEWKGRKLV